MAFYSSNYPYYYSNYPQLQEQIPFESGYSNLSYPQSQINYSDRNVNDPRYYYYYYNPPNYDSTSVSVYCNEYQYAPSKSLVAYSTIPEDEDGYYYDMTVQSTVYRSVNKPAEDLEFEEYDPDPYDGGYDIVRTYGKPLAPDDKICYPRSSSDPNTPHVDALPLTPVAAPYGSSLGIVDNKINSGVGSEPKPPPKDQVEGDFAGAGAGIAAAGAIAVAGAASAHDKGMSTAIKERDDQTNDDDDEDLTEDESDEEDHDDREMSVKATQEDEINVKATQEDEMSVKAIQEDEMREYGKKIYTMPPGYGLDSLDLCDGFFGYWPCLSKMRKDEPTIANGNHNYYQGNQVPVPDEWQMTADYLFGNLNPYGGGYGGDPVHAYHRHYHQDSSHGYL